MMKKLLIAIIFILTTTFASSDSVVMGYVEYYPLMFTNESGDPDGIFIDIFDEISKDTGIEIEYISSTLSFILESINSGDIDFFPSLYKTDERLEDFYFFNTPTFNAWSEVFVSDQNSLVELSDINGKEIGVVSGDVTSQEFLNFINGFDLNPTIVEFPSFEALRRAVVNDAVFGAASNNLFAYYDKGNIHSTNIVFSPFLGYMATSKNNTDTEVLQSLQMIDNQLQIMINTGELDYYYNIWTSDPIEIPYYIWWIMLILVSSIIVFILFTIVLKNRVEKQTKDVKKSRDMYERLFNLSQFGIVIVDSDNGNIIDTNRRTSTLFNVGRYDLIGKNILRDFSPKKQPTGDFSFEKGKSLLNKAKNEIIEFEWIHRDSSGKKFWASIHLKSFDNNTTMASIMDISDLKKYQKELEETIREKDVLLNEIHHRVKNNLGIISSILQMQLESVETLEDSKNLILNSITRIRSIAGAHTNLYENNSFSGVEIKSYIEKIVEDYLVETQPNNVIFVSKIKPLTIPVHQVIPVGITVNELVSNSVKHSFNNKSGGKITIGFYKSNGDYVLYYEDDGDSLPDSFRVEEQSSFGFQMIQILVEQLKGNIEFKKFKNKSIFILEFTREEYF